MEIFFGSLGTFLAFFLIGYAGTMVMLVAFVVFYDKILDALDKLLELC